MSKKKLSDRELMRILKIDLDTLNRFKLVRSAAITEAKRMNQKKNGKIKVVGISGSARDDMDMAKEKSNSEELLERCLRYCKDLGAEIELLPLRNYNIKYCKACYSTTNTQCHFYCSCYPRGKAGDDMTNILYDKIIAGDVIIFATPINNFKISTLMATFRIKS
ncbi:flavodoxin family protein [Candidatus Woesearchaeota archaeon]|nr:flavodoxin family protein [Candidatus Woesearchaeota archaeon]